MRNILTACRTWDVFVNGNKTRIFDIFVRVKVKPQLAFLRCDHWWKISPTELPNQAGKAMTTISNLQKKSHSVTKDFVQTIPMVQYLH